MDRNELSVIKYFNNQAKKRNKIYEEDTIYGYEQRMRQKVLLSLLKIKAQDVVLDAGCGNARDILHAVCSDAFFVGVDCSKEMLHQGYGKVKQKRLTKMVDLILGDITKLPFKSLVFDKIICSEVLEHIPRWKLAIKELSRVLKDKAAVGITTPNKISMYGLQKKFVNMFLRRWRPCDHFDSWKDFFVLRAAFMSQGLKVSDVRGANYLPGMLSYFHPLKVVIERVLPAFEKIEAFCSTNRLTKYLGFTIALHLTKGTS